MALLIIWWIIGFLFKLVLLSLWMNTEMKLMKITSIAGSACFFGSLISTILSELMKQKNIIFASTVIGSVFFVIPLFITNVFFI